MSCELDFSKFGPPVFATRPRGESLREKAKLPDLDRSDVQVNILIPDESLAITSSFFLGMFGRSVRLLGSRQAFFDKYVFRAPIHIMDDVEDGIKRALRERKGRID